MGSGDYITDAVNLFLDRFDRLIEAVERIAEALETDTESQR